MQLTPEARTAIQPRLKSQHRQPPVQFIAACVAAFGHDPQHVIASVDFSGEGEHTTWLAVALIPGFVVSVQAHAAVGLWTGETAKQPGGHRVEADFSAQLIPVRTVSAINLDPTSEYWSGSADEGRDPTLHTTWVVDFDGDHEPITLSPEAEPGYPDTRPEDFIQALRQQISG